MNSILNNSVSISDLSESEVDLIAGGFFEAAAVPTYERICRIDSAGNGWCFLKED